MSDVSPVRPFVGSTQVRPLEQPTRVLRLAALPTAPRMARMFTGQSVRLFGMSKEQGETALLLVSELVTNAVKRTGRVVGPPLPLPTETVAVVAVRLRLLADCLRLEVWDNDTTVPEPRLQDDSAEDGRGLFLVAALSRSWGSYSPAGLGANGKVVWCEVAR